MAEDGRTMYQRIVDVRVRALVAPALTLALVAVGLLGAQPVAAAGVPVLAYGGDFPDPGILVVGNTYYAYSTEVGSVNVPVMTSTDLTHWSAITDALKALPAWAAPGSTWAPTVLVRGGTYALYYTTRHAYSGRQCVSVATSASPRGPFIDTSSGPLVCQFSLGGSIDPSVFTDTNATSYLLWKSDNNALGRPTTLWGQQLAANGVGFARRSQPVALLSQDAAWQAPAIEGPALMRSGSTYYLFYGANRWDSATSGIGYATCARPLGPCTDRSTSGPWLSTSAAGTPPIGPQGPSVFTDLSGVTRLAFAGWNGTVGYPNGGVRALWTAPLTFVNGQPQLG